MTNLALVPIKETGALQPAAMHELAAAKYIGMNRTYFRELVFAGAIPFTEHMNGKTRIYLRSDLDAYLDGLPRRTMCPRENSLRPASMKGVGKQ
jgi:hypothetical protein